MQFAVQITLCGWSAFGRKRRPSFEGWRFFFEQVKPIHASRQAKPVRTPRESVEKSPRFALHPPRMRWLFSRGNSLLFVIIIFYLYGFPA